MRLQKKQEPTHRYDLVRKTTCGNCPTGCGLKIFLKGSEIIDIFGDEEHPINKGSICPKGMLSAYHLKNPNRLIYPQIRNSLGDPFRNVSWSEAIAFVTARIDEIGNREGKDAIFIYGDETAPFDYLAGASLFAKYYGIPNIPSRFFPAPFGNEGIIKEMFGIPGSKLLMNPQRDWSNSKCILLYGCDLAASDPITFGPILDARDRGITLIAIDTKKTVTTSKATLGLRINPGTKATLLRGVLNFFIQNDAVDNKFLKESTTGYEHLKSYTEQFTFRKVSEDCGAEIDDLRQLFELLLNEKPIQIIAGNWASRRYLSDEDLSLCAAIVCVSGSVGVPGGGLNLLNTSPFSWDDLWNREKDDSNSLALPYNINITDLLLHPQGNTGAIIWHGNPCARLPDGKNTKKVLKNIPFIVHFSSYPNETYHHSHVSLPISSWLEHSGLLASNNSRALQWHHKVTKAPSECRSPLQIWSDLASQLNLQKHFPWKTEDGVVDATGACNFFLQNNPLTQAASVEAIDPEKNPSGGLLWPCVEKADLEFENTRFTKGTIRGKNILFQRTEGFPITGKRFPTTDGKVSLSIIHQRCGGHTSAVGHDSHKFPFALTTGVLVDFIEAFGFFLSDREEYTKTGILHIHPQVGTALEVRNGDMVQVENRQGSIIAPVWLNPDLDPRIMWFPDGIDPFQPHMNNESLYNLFEKSGPDDYTMVAVFKQEWPKAKCEERISEFLRRFGNK